MTDMFVRVQEKGQVTIPSHLRRKLNLKKGDLVVFVETKDGVVIKPAELIVSDALDQIGMALKSNGLTEDEMLIRGRQIRERLLRDDYDLNETDEK
jgi:AbrB family looped-hinge helix DNA binding protein